MHWFPKFLCAVVALLIPSHCLAATNTTTASKAKVSSKATSRRSNTARSAYLRQLVNPAAKQNLGVAYFLELNRAGRIFKTNHKTKFRTADQIRFHVFSNADAYVYIIMRQGSKGTKSVLFPIAATGTNNLVKRGQDCIVPTENALQFDENPGVENVGLLLSRKKIDTNLLLNYPKHLTAYVPGPARPVRQKLPSRTKMSVEGSKTGVLKSQTTAKSSYDLVKDTASGKQLWRTASAALRDSNMVVVVNEGPEAVVAVDFSLIHEL